MEPADTDYLYFVTVNLATGKTKFARPWMSTTETSTSIRNTARPQMSADHASRRCGVLGSPIAHSLSPSCIGLLTPRLALTGGTTRRTSRRTELAAFVAELDSSWRGLSLTMPLKRAAIGLCDHVEPMAAQLEAVNTMVRESDGTWCGSNTDVPVAFARSRGG